MSKGGSAPAPVDPYQAAAAQYQYGAATADYNTALSRPSVNSPYGSIDWSTGGSNGSNYQPINVPGYGPMAYSPTVGSGGAAPSVGSVVNPGGHAGQGATPSGQGAIPTGTGTAAPYTPPQVTLSDPTRTATPTTQSTGQNSLRTAGGSGATSGTPGGTGGTTSGTVDPYALTAANTLTAPQYSENINLSPAQQQLLDLQEGTQISSGLTGQNLAGQAASSLSAPITSTPIQTKIDTSGVSAIPGASDLSGFTTQAQQAAYAQQTQYLDPQFNQEQEQLQAQLVNQGAQPGTPAYDNAMQLFNNQKQQAYESASNNSIAQGLTEQQALYGEGANTNQQQFGEAATTQSADNTGAGQQLSQELGIRDQPLNELSTEYGLSNPNGVSSLAGGTTGSGGAGSATAPDILSAFNTSAQQQEANYNAGVSESNANEGAAASLASSYLMYLALA